MVRHDDDDPYLVVAADKGTVGFSDVMVDVVAFVVRDVICSGIQVLVVVAIVWWWWQKGRELPTRAFVADGWRRLLAPARP